MWKKWSLLAIAAALGLFIIPYSFPFIFAFLTAIMFEGTVQFFKSKIGFRRLHAVTFVFISYVVLLSVLGFKLISVIAEQAVTLSQQTPFLIRELNLSVIKPLISEWEFYSKSLPADVSQSVENSIQMNIESFELFVQSALQTLLNMIAGIPGFLIEFLIYLIALFLFSKELPRLKEKVSSFMTEQTRSRVFLVARQLNKAGIGFIKAQIILSFITFVMAFTGLSILGVSYTVILSLLIVVVDILPILGTGSVLVPWAVVAIFQNNTFLGIGLIVLFFVITVVRRIIEPKIYSSNLGISPLASLVSMFIGFKLLGFSGLFIGPALVIIFDTLKKAEVFKIDFKI